MKKLSIITINYNNFDGLQQTFKSVMGQSCADFEYIIIDGGSSDESKIFLEQNSDKIDYWVSEKDNGIYNALNKGVAAANGEYLLLLNSGDFFENNDALKNVFREIHTTDLIYCDLRITLENDSVVKRYDEQLTFSFLLDNSLPFPATFIKRKIFIDHGCFAENFKIVSDWKFFIEVVCLKSCSYRRIPLILTVFNTEGVSSDPANQDLIAQEKQQVLNQHFGAFLKNNQELIALRKSVKQLKMSKKIRLLLRFKLLNPF